MKIVKGQTTNFEDYTVTQPLRRGLLLAERLLRLPIGALNGREEIADVLEADDQSGQLIQQVCDAEGCAVYTNGADEIVLTNEARLLLLLPDVRQHFLRAGFRPKTTSHYIAGLRIVNRRAIVRVEQTVLLESEAQE